MPESPKVLTVYEDFLRVQRDEARTKRDNNEGEARHWNHWNGRASAFSDALAALHTYRQSVPEREET